MDYEITCVNPSCGFRVPSTYFRDKSRKFSPTSCPRAECGAPLQVVELGTNKVVPGAYLTVGEPGGLNTGRLVMPRTKAPEGGALEFVSIAAATAVVGYDLLQNSRLRQSNVPRQLVAAGLAGSASAGDTEVELFAGTDFLGKLFNTSTGFPRRDDVFRFGARVPAGTEVQARIVDAPATNPINLALDFEELGGGIRR